MDILKLNSVKVAKISIKMATSSRNEEEVLTQKYKENNILTAAVDIGGSLLDSIPKILESALVASKRSGIIGNSHVEEGALVGAAREALMQVTAKANGLSVGGKIGMARAGEHLAVCIFLSIGLIHLNEVVIGLAHRSIARA